MLNNDDLLSKSKLILVTFVENLTKEKPNEDEIVYNKGKDRVEFFLQYKERSLRIVVLLKYPHAIKISVFSKKEKKYRSRYVFPSKTSCIDTALSKLNHALEPKRNFLNSHL